VPGVLVEMGYLSNKYEGLKFKDNEFLDRIIKAVARGIIEYKKRYETTEGFTNI
jgi:N-acetylmuramoyl-L-alanine amidase